VGGEKGDQDEEKVTARSCGEGRIWEGRKKSKRRRREVKNSAEGNAWEERRESRRRRKVRESVGRRIWKGRKKSKRGREC
jgi:hypothetical protein